MRGVGRVSYRLGGSWGFERSFWDGDAGFLSETVYWIFSFRRKDVGGRRGEEFKVCTDGPCIGLCRA